MAAKNPAAKPAGGVSTRVKWVASTMVVAAAGLAPVTWTSPAGKAAIGWLKVKVTVTGPSVVS